MIKTFKCAEAQKLYERHRSRKLAASIQRIVMHKLWLLPVWMIYVQLLKGNRAGQHSIRINQQWRICFKWNHGHAYEVEIVDYH